MGIPSPSLTAYDAINTGVRLHQRFSLRKEVFGGQEPTESFVRCTRGDHHQRARRSLVTHAALLTGCGLQMRRHLNGLNVTLNRRATSLITAYIHGLLWRVGQFMSGVMMCLVCYLKFNVASRLFLVLINVNNHEIEN